MDLSKFLAHSAKVETHDLDWELAARIGLSDDEATILTYFADIEGQTIFYLREILSTKAAMESDVIGFTTMWNYEEYFHAEALARLLRVCGHELSKERTSRVRATAKLRARIEDLVQRALGRIFRPQFPALYMAWGASQELLTLRGYEQIIRNTANPVLRELCERIAKQERRHFAWYFNSARKRLAASGMARILTRWAFRYWTPVGVGVKSIEESHALAQALFAGDLPELAADYDRKLTELPGLEGMEILRRFAREVQATRSAAPVASLAS